MSNKLMKSLAGLSLLFVVWSPFLFFIPILLILINEKLIKDIVIKSIIVLLFSVLSYMFPINIPQKIYATVFGALLIICWNPLNSWLNQVNDRKNRL